MSMGHTFQEFGELVDELESTGVNILNITPDKETLLTDESLSLTLSVGVPLFDEIDTNDIEITSQDSDALTDGALTVDFSVRVPLRHDSEDRSPENQLEGESDHSEDNPKQGDAEPENTEESQSRESKVYRDPDRLREVYDEYGTFSEMTDALDVDVTPETVRSNMIKQGIHEPATDVSETEVADSDSHDDGQESEVEIEQPSENEETVLSDGMGLPAGMTLDEFETTIQTSRSFLDVQRELGGDRDYTYQILKKFNLIDVVHGRLSKQAERETSLEEIDNRIHQSMTQ